MKRNSLVKSLGITSKTFNRRVKKQLESDKQINLNSLRNVGNSLLTLEETVHCSSNPPMVSDFVYSDVVNEIFYHPITSDEDDTIRTDKEDPIAPDEDYRITSDDETSSKNEIETANEVPDLSQKTMSQKLKSWALENNITHSAINGLLNILNEHNFNLPKDSRSLLNTPRNSHTFLDVEPGKYWHYGLNISLQRIFRDIDYSLNEIEISFNIDGIPISRSSPQQFWPILGSVIVNNKKVIFEIGIYYGNAKPKNIFEYLRDFIIELKQLVEFGVSINNKNFKLKINGFICDTPARASIKGIKGHTGRYCCERCEVEGEYCHDTHRMFFNDLDAKERNDSSFRLREQKQHHLSSSPLEDLPINMVKDFLLDYLHLICLGVMKKLLNIWKGNFARCFIRWTARTTNEITNVLISIQKTQPMEFNRPVRGLNVLRYWKGTEFRTFLLYVGPVVLRDFVSNEVYQNFLSLHCAVSICISNQYTKYLPIAGKLFNEFITEFANIYGKSFV